MDVFSGNSLGITIPQTLGWRKTVFFSVAPTVVVAADGAFTFSGKPRPVTILVSTQIQEKRKTMEVRKHGKAKKAKTAT